MVHSSDIDDDEDVGKEQNDVADEVFPKSQDKNKSKAGNAHTNVNPPRSSIQSAVVSKTLISKTE